MYHCELLPAPSRIRNHLTATDFLITVGDPYLTTFAVIGSTVGAGETVAVEYSTNAIPDASLAGRRAIEVLVPLRLM